jgi:NADPH:quinone reductase-like Zn-dependent oxidoreductase
MSLSSLSWALPGSRAAGRTIAVPGSPIAVALVRCMPLLHRSVLVVASGERGQWEAVRLAREDGGCVTALCPADQAGEAKAAGADVVLDPARTDPTWYRGAWSVIVDPGASIGFRRARASLSPGGVYVTPSPGLPDRARALLARLNGGPRLLRLRE